jgi:hypothetical protein
MNVRQLDSVGQIVFAAEGKLATGDVAGTEDRPGNDGTSGTFMGEHPSLTVLVPRGTDVARNTMEPSLRLFRAAERQS